MNQTAQLGIHIRSTGAPRATNELDRLHNQSARTERATDGLQRKTAGTARSMLSYAAGLGAALVSVNALRSGVQQVVAVNAEFEQTLSGVRAVTRATDREMAGMTRTARQLGATTRFSASQAADGMRFLGMAGFETNEIIAAMPGLLDLATAGNLDLARAADIASNVLSGFNLQAGESSRVADLLAAASSSANTSVEQLGEGMRFVAPIAASLGVEIEMVTAAMGVLSDAGLQGSMAGTGLRRVLSTLSRETSQNTRILSNYGLTFEAVNAQVHDLTTIVQRFADVNLTAADALQMFGDRGAPAILALTAQTGRLRDLNEEMNTSAGRASEMAEAMGDNLRGDLMQLRSAIEEVFLTAGDFNNVLRESAQLVTNLLRRFSTDRTLADVTVDLLQAEQKLSDLNRAVETREGPMADFVRDWGARVPQAVASAEREIEKFREEYEGFIEGMSTDEIRAVVREMRELADLDPSERPDLDFDTIMEARRKLNDRLYELNVEAMDREEELRAEASEKRDRDAEIEAAQAELERQRQLQEIHDFLMDEEDKIRASYERRMDLVRDNTEENSEVRAELLSQLEEHLEQELTALTQHERNRAELLERREEQEKEREAQRQERVLDSLHKEFQTEREALDEWYREKNDLILNAEFEIESQRQEMLYRMEQEHQRRRRQLQSREWDQALSSFGDFQDNMEILARTHGGTMARIYQAGAIARTVISTYESAQNAFNALAGIPYVGPALGAAAAGAAIAAGMARVQAIRSQSVEAYAHGGMIPAGRDGITQEEGFEVVRGPAVVTSARATQDRYLQGQGSKSNVTNVVIKNYTNAKPVVRETKGKDGESNVEVLLMAREQEQNQGIVSGNGALAQTLESTYKLERRAQ